MNDLSPEARRTLAQAKSGQPRASQALRTRVKANVLRAVAAEPVDMPLQAAGNSSALSKSAFSKLPAWALPTLGAFAVIGGIATFAARPTAVDQSPAMPRQEAPASQLETAALERRAPDDGELEPMVAAPEAQEPQLSPRTKARAPAVSQARRAEPARDGDLRA
ncbi:MAG TPA: hypothetical protein VMF89_01085, partial [Polyangiales bacterium]|nr:hypothetical protein [Polyangiales bacterium]